MNLKVESTEPIAEPLPGLNRINKGTAFGAQQNLRTMKRFGVYMALMIGDAWGNQETLYDDLGMIEGIKFLQIL